MALAQMQVKGVPFSKLQGNHDPADRGHLTERRQFPIDRGIVRPMEPVMRIPSGARPVPMLPLHIGINPRALMHGAEILELDSNLSTARSSGLTTPADLNSPVPGFRMGQSGIGGTASTPGHAATSLVSLADTADGGADGMGMHHAPGLPYGFSDGPQSSRMEAQGSSIYAASNAGPPDRAEQFSEPAAVDRMDLQTNTTNALESAAAYDAASSQVHAHSSDAAAISQVGRSPIPHGLNPSAGLAIPDSNNAELEGSIFGTSPDAQESSLAAGTGSGLRSNSISRGLLAATLDGRDDSQLGLSIDRPVSRDGSEASLSLLDPDATGMSSFSDTITGHDGTATFTAGHVNDIDGMLSESSHPSGVDSTGRRSISNATLNLDADDEPGSRVSATVLNRPGSSAGRESIPRQSGYRPGSAPPSDSGLTFSRLPDSSGLSMGSGPELSFRPSSSFISQIQAVPETLSFEPTDPAGPAISASTSEDGTAQNAVDNDVSRAAAGDQDQARMQRPGTSSRAERSPRISRVSRSFGSTPCTGATQASSYQASKHPDRADSLLASMMQSPDDAYLRVDSTAGFTSAGAPAEHGYSPRSRSSMGDVSLRDPKPAGSRRASGRIGGKVTTPRSRPASYDGAGASMPRSRPISHDGAGATMPRTRPISHDGAGLDGTGQPDTSSTRQPGSSPRSQQSSYDGSVLDAPGQSRSRFTSGSGKGLSRSVSATGLTRSGSASSPRVPRSPRLSTSSGRPSLEGDLAVPGLNLALVPEEQSENFPLQLTPHLPTRSSR